MDEKGPEQWDNNIVVKLNLNTALKVRGIIDDLINTLDFRHKLEIAVSDILSSILYIVPVAFLRVKKKVNQKIRTYAWFHWSSSCVNQIIVHSL